MLKRDYIFFGSGAVIVLLFFLFLNRNGCGTTTYYPQTDSIALYKDSIAFWRGQVSGLEKQIDEKDSIIKVRAFAITNVENRYYTIESSLPKETNPDTAYYLLKGFANQ